MYINKTRFISTTAHIFTAVGGVCRYQLYTAKQQQESTEIYLFLTLNLLTTTIVAPPSNASKWQMGFNSAFKGLMIT